MKEHPILFSAPMVRAILSGQKTQTRRPVTAQTAIVNGSARVRPEVFARYPLDKAWVDQGPSPAGNRGPYLKVDSTHPDDDGAMVRLYSPWCAGDHLWVRENAYIAPPDFGDADQCNATDKEGHRRLVGYSASMDGDSRRCAEDFGVKQTPSIHMPRWACRLILVVADVRPQQLHEITEEDALAEGIQIDRRNTPPFFLGGTHKVKGTPKVFYTARDAFDDLWADTYGQASWDANPWVWVVSFRRVV